MDKGLICAGDVLIARYVNGVADQFFPPVNFTKFAIAPTAADKIERKSRMRETNGQILGAINDPQAHEFSGATDSFSGEIMAMLFSGTRADLNESSGTGVSATGLDLSQGNWVPLGQRNVSNVAVIGSVEGTDFEVNTRIGMIKAIAGGNLEADNAVDVTFDHGAVTGSRTSGATETQVEVMMILDGINLDDNSDVIVTIDKVLISPDGEVDFLSDEYAGVEISGSMITLDGKNSPYTIDEPAFA